MSARAWKRGICLGFSIAVAGGAAADDLLTVHAASALGDGQVGLQSSALTYDPAARVWHAAFGAQNILAEDGSVVASISAGDVWVRDFSQIDMNLTLVAGVAQASIDIASLNLALPHIAAGDAQARARARCQIFDLNGNGAQLISNGTPGEGVFRATINPGRADEALFSQLVGFVSCGAGGNAYGQQLDPPSGMRAVGAAVDGYAIGMGFLLSAGDRIVISTTFDLGPNPSSCLGDINGDEQVALSDLITLIGNYGMQDAPLQAGDLNDDGTVDMSDLSDMLGAFGDRCM